MRICENGIYRDMTAEEIAAWEEMKEQQALSEPTIEERLEAAEARWDMEPVDDMSVMVVKVYDNAENMFSWRKRADG